MSWVLIIVLANGVGSVKEPRLVAMTEAQCKAAVRGFEPIRAKVGAICVGPGGELFTFEDLDR